ncbi:MAG: HAMP domain-containing methyl-accepting chemotaxis protein [bacterium]
MKLMSNFNIGKKIFFVIGIILVLNLLIFVFSFFGINESHKSFRNIIDNNLGTVNELQKSKVNILLLRRYEKDIFLNVGNSSKTEEYKAKWDKTNHKLTKNLAFIDTKLELMKLKNELNTDTKIKSNLKIYEEGLNSIYSDINDGVIDNPKAANKALSQYKKSIRQIEDLLENNIKSIDKRYILMDKQNSNLINTLEFIMIILMTSSIAVSVVLSLILIKLITSPIENVVNNLNEVAKGNLSVKELEIEAKDETGILALALNLTVQNLKKLIGSVTTSIEDISASSQEMAASSDQTALGSQQTATTTAQLAQGAQEISRSVEQGAVTITKMNKVIQEISEEAKTVAKLGNDTEINANQGSKHVQNAIGKIDNIKTVSADISITVAKLGTLSSEIETIVDLIKGIAGQTNLLALNAAIEAARAGEQGKGFAVVAEEVKKLATQSAEATDKITDMIKEIQTQTGIAVSKMDKATNEVQEGVTVVNEAGKALDQIISQVKTANSKIQEITKEIDGVAHNSEDVVRMIENISAITEETAASAEEISSITQEQTASMQEISAGSQSLAQIVQNLNEKVSVFKV